MLLWLAAVVLAAEGIYRCAALWRNRREFARLWRGKSGGPASGS